MTGTERKRAWRAKHPDRAKHLDSKLRSRRRRLQKDFVAWLRKGLCLDCKEEHTDLTFDHVQGPKLFNVGSFRKPYGRPTWSQLMTEIAKCERVCAGCHLIRTRSRGHRWRPPVYEPAPF